MLITIEGPDGAGKRLLGEMVGRRLAAMGCAQMPVFACPKDSPLYECVKGLLDSPAFRGARAAVFTAVTSAMAARFAPLIEAPTPMLVRRWDLSILAYQALFSAPSADLSLREWVKFIRASGVPQASLYVVVNAAGGRLEARLAREGDGRAALGADKLSRLSHCFTQAMTTVPRNRLMALWHEDDAQFEALADQVAERVQAMTQRKQHAAI